MKTHNESFGMSAGRPLRIEVWREIDFGVFDQIMAQTALEARVPAADALAAPLGILLNDQSIPLIQEQINAQSQRRSHEAR